MPLELVEALWLWSARGGFLAALVCACVMDIRHRRIPNWLTVGVLIFGILWNSFAPEGAGLFDRSFPGGVGFLKAASGAVAVLLVFLVFYALRVTGAGDAKLMAALGGFFGLTLVPGFVLMVLLAGGVLSVVRMITSRSSARVGANLLAMFFSLFERKSFGSPHFDPVSQSADQMPYALAIATGAIFYAVVKWAGLTTVI